MILVELTNSINELAPKSNRSSFVSFGNVTGNNRIRVARISKIFNSVKLKTNKEEFERYSFRMKDYRPKLPGKNSNNVSLRYNSFKLTNIVNPSHNLNK
jgi:hypothetical protein